MSQLLKGSLTDYMLDEMERALHDSLSVIKRTLESGRVVPGGGAVETALSIYLENFATTLGSREQLAIAEFAQALLIIPKTLAVNAAKDSTDLVAKLRAYHNAAQMCAADDPKRQLRFYGLDLLDGVVRDNAKAGVLEPTVSKIRSLKSALEACTSLLRVSRRSGINNWTLLMLLSGRLMIKSLYPRKSEVRPAPVIWLDDIANLWLLQRLMTVMGIRSWIDMVEEECSEIPNFLMASPKAMELKSGKLQANAPHRRSHQRQT